MNARELLERYPQLQEDAGKLAMVCRTLEKGEGFLLLKEAFAIMRPETKYRANYALHTLMRLPIGLLIAGGQNGTMTTFLVEENLGWTLEAYEQVRLALCRLHSATTITSPGLSPQALKALRSLFELTQCDVVTYYEISQEMPLENLVVLD